MKLENFEKSLKCITVMAICVISNTFGASSYAESGSHARGLKAVQENVYIQFPVTRTRSEYIKIESEARELIDTLASISSYQWPETEIVTVDIHSKGEFTEKSGPTHLSVRIKLLSLEDTLCGVDAEKEMQDASKDCKSILTVLRGIIDAVSPSVSEIHVGK